MSVETWKVEFASTPADSPELKTAVDRLDRDLWKWIGLLPKNLEKHGCWVANGLLTIDVVDKNNNHYKINSNNCSLCTHYIDYNSTNECEKCPLYKEVGANCSPIRSPWTDWAKRKDPIPMIEALAGALDKALEEEVGV